MESSPQAGRGTTRRLAYLDGGLHVLSLHHGTDTLACLRLHGSLLFLLFLLVFLGLVLSHGAPGRRRLLLLGLDLLRRHLIDLLHLLLLGLLHGWLGLHFVLAAVVAAEREV